MRLGVLALTLLPQYDCRTCTPYQKMERGCETDAILPLQLDGEDLLRCPRRPILEEPELWSELLQKFADYKEGRLPEGGGLQDQPHAYLEYVRVMSSAKAEADELREKRAKMAEEPSQ